MQFQNTQPIFMQIVDYVCDEVLRGTLTADQQLPSVRDLAVELEVNPNTVMRAVERLLGAGIVYSQRGRGNFLAADAADRIRQMRRERLSSDTLPRLADEMILLGVKPSDVADELQALVDERHATAAFGRHPEQAGDLNHLKSS